MLGLSFSTSLNSYKNIWLNVERYCAHVNFKTKRESFIIQAFLSSLFYAGACLSCTRIKNKAFVSANASLAMIDGKMAKQRVVLTLLAANLLTGQKAWHSINARGRFVGSLAGCSLKICGRTRFASIIIFAVVLSMVWHRWFAMWMLRINSPGGND